MTDILHRHGRAEALAPLPRFRVRDERDRTLLDSLLSEDRALSAYALAHLEYGLFEEAQYFTSRGDEGDAVLVHTSGGLGPATFTTGDPAALDAALSLHPGPRTSYLATAEPAHMPVLERYFEVSGALEMRRMGVHAGNFVRDESTPRIGELRRLRGEDARALNALYSTEGPATSYGPQHIARGVYCGVFEGGRLLSVAGTHVVAPNVGIAVLGNVFTLASHRGMGLARRVTSAVTAELLDHHGCTLVALTVNPANTPAVRAYTGLGYVPGAPVVEARLRRRATLDVGSSLRRWMARRAAHGGTPGDEETSGRAPYAPAAPERGTR